MFGERNTEKKTVFIEYVQVCMKVKGLRLKANLTPKLKDLLMLNMESNCNMYPLLKYLL